MWGKCKILLAVLLTVIVITTVISGCASSASRGTHNPKIDPFVTGRITTVRIVMVEAEDWSYCRDHAFEERYVPADFWFGDELVPDVGGAPLIDLLRALGQEEIVSLYEPETPVYVERQ